jgi:formylglycine-generating enzyme required for sulfatase activity
MADVFISYSKTRRAEAAELARELGDLGYSVWWDTSLLPTGSFTTAIDRELNAAKAVLVIWSPESVLSKWVRSEARHADRQDKLINTHTVELDNPGIRIPIPFNETHSVGIDEIRVIVGALDALGVPRSGGSGPAAPVVATADTVADADDRLFAEVQKANTAEAYEYYLAELPQGRHVSIARFWLKMLRPPGSPAPAPLPQQTGQREERPKLAGDAVLPPASPSAQEAATEEKDKPARALAGQQTPMVQDHEDSLSLGNLCCYLAYYSKWSKDQITHSPSYSVHIENEIRDAFSQSKITGIGRRFDPRRPDWLAQKAALVSIPSDWWDGKHIEVWRALNGETTVANRVYDDQTKQSGYHDLRVNRVNAERQWPPKSANHDREDSLSPGRAPEAQKQSADEVEAKQQAEEQRRIKVDARIVHGAPDGWFLPGNGKVEWFQDYEYGPEMVVVPAGSFVMGSPEGEPDGSGTESPQHNVTIGKPFAIARCAVTRGQFTAFVNNTEHRTEREALVWNDGWRQDPKASWRDPGFTQDDNHPVVGVSWDDAKAYVAWLSSHTHCDYRLPTEAEWEYCCRARSTSPFWWGSSIAPTQANYDGNYMYEGGGSKGEWRQATVPVNQFAANPWGLYQVHGNVWEWCEDVWHGDYTGAPADGSAWLQGDGDRVVRGGSWYCAPGALRSANRFSPLYLDCDLGFRVGRTL